MIHKGQKFISLCAFLLISHFINAQISGPSVVEYNSTQTYTEPTIPQPPNYYSTYFISEGGTVTGYTQTQITILWNKAAFGNIQRWLCDTYGCYLICSLNVTVQNVPRTGYFYDAAGNRTSRETIYLNRNMLKSGSIDTTENNLASNPEEEKSIERQLEGLDIKIYPNPTSGRLRVNLTGLDQTLPSSISILSINGAVVDKISPATTSNEIDLSEKPDGVYIMLVSANNKSAEWKIVKQ